ncbi:MAG: PDZ domain-containing protein [Planctomycetes bacterium]|nr:PDZ domain-containing protein [Planctomycetota bacterium]
MTPMRAAFATLSLVALASLPVRADDPVSRELADLAARLSPSVVAVGQPSRGEAREARPWGGWGSGFVVDPSGLILSSTAALPEPGAETLVFLADGTRLVAEELGRDPLHAAVLLACEAGRPLAALPLADRLPEVGQTAMALGNPYGSLTSDRQVAFSLGVVSGIYLMGEGLGDYRGLAVETTAAVNPGSFGGPLVDLDGRVIGLVDATLDRTRWLGVAVPASLLGGVLEDLREGRPAGQGFLGAEGAGLRAGDRILAVEGRRVEGAAELGRLLVGVPEGTHLTLSMVRDGMAQQLPVVLGPRPALVAGMAAVEGGYLGVLLTEEGEGAEGALVEGVQPEGPAARAGIRKGDRVLKAGEHATPNGAALIRVLEGCPAGTKLVLRVGRDGWEKEVGLVLAERPREEAPRAVRPFLGLGFDGDEPVVAEVAPGGPADKAGIRAGDRIVMVADRKVGRADDLAGGLEGRRPGETVKLRVEREGWQRTLEVVLGTAPGEAAPVPAPPPPPPVVVPSPPPPVVPAPPAGDAGFLGVTLEDAKGGGALVEEVMAGSAAETAGIQAGDVIVEAAGKPIGDADGLIGILSASRAGDKVRLVLTREGWRRDLEVTMGRRSP